MMEKLPIRREFGTPGVSDIFFSRECSYFTSTWLWWCSKSPVSFGFTLESPSFQERGRLPLSSSSIVKLMDGWILFSVDRNSEADWTMGRFAEASCFGLSVVLRLLWFVSCSSILHKCICHEWSVGRAHSKNIHLLLQISFEMETLVFRRNL